MYAKDSKYYTGSEEHVLMSLSISIFLLLWKWCCPSFKQALITQTKEWNVIYSIWSEEGDFKISLAYISIINCFPVLRGAPPFTWTISFLGENNCENFTHGDRDYRKGTFCLQKKL